MSKLSLAVVLFATTFCLFQDAVEATCCAHCLSGCRKHPGGCDSLCSSEYRLVNFYCIPRCGGNCKQGYCYGINDCHLCRPGYHVNLGGTCDAGTCDPHCTDTIKCARAGTCYTQLCVPGYAYDAYLYYCVPVVAQTTVTAGPSTTPVPQTTGTTVAAPSTVAQTTAQTTGATAQTTAAPATTSAAPVTTIPPTTPAATTPALTTVVTTPLHTTIVTTPVATTVQTTMHTTAPLCQAVYCNGTCSAKGAGTCDPNNCIPNYITDTSNYCQACDAHCVPTIPGGCYGVGTTYYAGTCNTSPGCVSGYVLSTATYQCQACATGCTAPTCPSAGTCTSGGCSPSTVWNSATGNCDPCASHCTGCTTAGYCDGSGVCASGYGKTSTGSQCGACALYCSVCSTNGAGKCDTGSCATGYALDPSTLTCLACQGSTYCQTAFGCPAPGTCNTCASGFTLNPTTKVCS